MEKEDFDDWLPTFLKILLAILLVVLILGSVYTFSRVNKTLKNIEANVDAQVKEAIKQLRPPSISQSRQTNISTDSVSAIVARAREAFEANDILEGRRQLVLLEQALEKKEGAEKARQLNSNLIAAIDKGDINAAQTLASELLKELEEVN